jgi:hypothetical protein
LPSCDFCGRKGHTKTTCRIKQKSTAYAKKDTKDRSAHWKKDTAEKAQSFSAAASTSKQKYSSSEEDEDDKDKKALLESFMASWKSSKKDKKAQKNKRKRSYNDTRDSEQKYSTSFKLVALKRKRARIGIPTTGETTVNDSKKPVRVLLDTSSSSSIILNKSINVSLLVKNSITTTEWTALSGKFYTKKQGIVKFKLPELFLNKTIEFKLDVDETTVHDNATYDISIGIDLISELKLVLDFDTQCISWVGFDPPMKKQGGLLAYGRTKESLLC